MDNEVLGFSRRVAKRIYDSLPKGGAQIEALSDPLEDGPRSLLVFAPSPITARVGTTLGVGVGIIQRISASGVVSPWTNGSGGNTTITIRNSSTTELPAGYMQVKREAISGVWLVDVASCS